MSRLKRRDVLNAGLSAAAACALGPAANAAAPRRRPNIVFIMADDMGYADIGCNGRPDIKTPHIDSIAAAGINLRQGYANSAVCSATRTALITGRYQYRLRLGLEEPLGGASKTVGLPPEHPTLPSLLKKAGYRTALIGKWHLGELPNFGPLKSGYDRFFGFRTGAVDYFTHMPGPTAHDLWDGDTPVERDGYLTTLLGQRAVQTIDDYAAGEAPFMISLHFNAPHWPWEGPGDRAESDRIRRESNIRHVDGGSTAAYAAMIGALDDQVGAVLAALKRHNLTDNTIVVFTSDNGGERFADVWPFSGQKEELLEGGLRVPTLVSWPAVLPRNVRNDQVAISMDWLPTLLAAAGTAPDPAYPPDGINLLPVLTGAARPQPRKLFWRYKANNQRALRDGDLKYLRIRKNEFLFDVVADPLERGNLKTRQPEVFARMRADWRAWNAAMLPELDETSTEGVLAATQADHIGAEVTVKTADPGD